ncbi:hypothetical protein Pcinc_025340 [Petrolisthes cinctipes]|uniref:Ig-like domain-containing protein n=1 Tax=Petrolisthes cinctipes TaxID=88211 RepID=A0AAE1F919_PETCI|nr:hypothetical protein Pcinc_025340 [Petrolisthes cinctipes]
MTRDAPTALIISWVWVWVWVAISLLHHAQGVRVSRVSLPQPALVGEPASLRCHFSTPNGTFFSVRWYKDERQFYSFVPDRTPVKQAHYLPGLFVEVPESDEHVVQLRRVEVDNEGVYSCEVIGGKPFFKSSSSTANLSVACELRMRMKQLIRITNIGKRVV